MKRSGKYILLLIIPVFGTGFGTGLLWYQFRDVARNFFRSETLIEHENLHWKCTEVGVILPENARNVNFFKQTGGPDFECYIAFSASAEDIERTLVDLENKLGQGKEADSKNYIVREVRTPRTFDGQVVKWWTEMPPDIVVRNGAFFWTGTDKTGNRVYIYRHSI